jgi:nucleoside-diphosphate-sugar epimerase
LNRKILITGANGFLGYNLTKKLVKKDFLVTSLCRRKNFYLEPVKGASYIYCDLTNLPKLKKKIKDDYDCVLNFSGNIDHNDKSQTLKVHYLGLKNIFKIFEKRKLDLFIQAGSSLEYGRSLSPQTEKMKCNPISIYGKIKYKASKLVIKNRNRFKFIILRLYQIYGPYQKNNRLVPFIIKSCLKNKKFNCTEGIQKRDFLYVDDLVNLIVKILKKKQLSSGIYNVGYGKSILVKNVIKKVNAFIKKGKPDFGKIKMRKDEIVNLYPDIRKIKNTFNWKPKVNIAEGLKKTINYHENSK